jgi:hypothetical protein
MRPVPTTVHLDDQLLADGQALAGRTHRTIDAVTEEALRRLLRHSTPATLPDFSYPGGLQPGVGLQDKELMSQILGESR